MEYDRICEIIQLDALKVIHQLVMGKVAVVRQRHGRILSTWSITQAAQPQTQNKQSRIG